MLGNVWEWCEDCYFDLPGPSVGPLPPPSSSKDRVFRGGDYSHAAAIARSALRTNDEPGYASGTLGLRPARGLSE